MRRLAYTYRTRIDFSVPVRDHYFTLRCLPRETPNQHTVTQRLSLEPETPWAIQRDGFGNLLQVGSCREGHMSFGYTAEGVSIVDRSVPDRSPCSPMFSYPSPLTRPGPALTALYQAQGQGKTPEELTHLVHQAITYAPGATGVNTTAEEALVLGQGVCQDEAHILIALCRMAGLPARYACGLFVGEGATHAWAEVFENGQWQGWDPTRDCPVDEGYLVLSYGRDYSDCPVERGVFRGNTGQTQTVFMQVKDCQ